LNAHHENNFLRLADYTSHIGELDPEKDNTMFHSFLDTLRYQLTIAELEADILDFEIISHLNSHWMKIGNPEAVFELFNGHLYPFLNQLYSEEIPDNVLQEYNALLSRSISYSRKFMGEKANLFIQQKIREGKLRNRPALTLSAMVCQQYLDDGVDHVLVGMKREPYVNDMSPLFI
jgi:hypothetical protein